MILEFRKLDKSAKKPKYAHENDAGMDLFTLDKCVLRPGEISKVRTGIAMNIPSGYVGIIKDKSSIASAGISTLAGVVDAGYQGEIVVVMQNLNTTDYIFEKGQKFSQILIHKVENPKLVLVKEFDDVSSRGSGGFGSTGTV